MRVRVRRDTLAPSVRCALLLAVLIALATGCASSAGTAKAIGGTTHPDTTRFTKLSITAGTKGDVTLSAADQDRIVQLIAARIKERAMTRFSEVGVLPAAPDTLHVRVAFTRYDEGNAFARFMLAGLGQIHIDAEVTLAEGDGSALLGRYMVTKTFAWGGLYGVATSIKDVEAGFADAVADVVLGKVEY
jgi:hypothetical protein